MHPPVYHISKSTRYRGILDTAQTSPITSSNKLSPPAPTMDLTDLKLLLHKLRWQFQLLGGVGPCPGHRQGLAIPAPSRLTTPTTQSPQPSQPPQPDGNANYPAVLDLALDIAKALLYLPSQPTSPTTQPPHPPKSPVQMEIPTTVPCWTLPWT